MNENNKSENRKTLLLILLLVGVVVFVIILAIIIASKEKEPINNEFTPYQKTYSIIDFSSQPIENIECDLSKYPISLPKGNSTSFLSVKVDTYSWYSLIESNVVDKDYVINFEANKIETNSFDKKTAYYQYYITINGDQTKKYMSTHATIYSNGEIKNIPKFYYYWYVNNMELIEDSFNNTYRVFEIHFNVVNFTEDNKIVFNNYIFHQKYPAHLWQYEENTYEWSENELNDLDKYLHDLYLIDPSHTCPYEKYHR